MNFSKEMYRYGRDPLSVFLLGCVWLAAAVTFLSLAFLLFYILWQGLPNLSPKLFELEYSTENVSMFPALLDTLIMVVLALLMATPLGIFAAIAGSCTVAIMILPLIMRTTEEALRAVPDSYREGSYGLGAGKLRTVFAVVLPSAVPGILAGVILGIGRIVGETAALIYTAGTVAALPTNVMSSGRTLAVHMYALLNEGLYTEQAYATAVVLLVLVVCINALSSFVAKKAGVKEK